MDDNPLMTFIYAIHGPSMVSMDDPRLDPSPASPASPASPKGTKGAKDDWQNHGVLTVY